MANEKTDLPKVNMLQLSEDETKFLSVLVSHSGAIIGGDPSQIMYMAASLVVAVKAIGGINNAIDMVNELTSRLAKFQGFPLCEKCGVYHAKADDAHK